MDSKRCYILPGILILVLLAVLWEDWVEVRRLSKISSWDQVPCSEGVVVSVDYPVGRKLFRYYFTIRDDEGKRETFFRGLAHHDLEKLRSIMRQRIRVCYVELWQALPLPMTYKKPVRIYYPDGEVSELVPPTRMAQNTRESAGLLIMLTVVLSAGTILLCNYISRRD